jgi:hypothetical protein
MQIPFWVVVTGLAVLAIGLYWYLQIERYSIQVQRYIVPLNSLPRSFEGLTILHLSDLHNKQFGFKQKKLIKIINQQEYDLVALTGDFVNKFKPDFKPAIDLLEQLSKVPIFFVPGNHEGRTGFKAKETLLALGVRILDNKAEKLLVNGQYIWVVGVDDPHLNKDDLNKALEKVDGLFPKLLLSHSPKIYPEAIESKIDLVLVGHTHGGQVRLPFIGAAVAPGQGLFPKWDYGFYQKDQTAMIINCGLGESDLPIRFNIKPEIVLVTLRPA